MSLSPHSRSIDEAVEGPVPVNEDLLVPTQDAKKANNKSNYARQAIKHWMKMNYPEEFEKHSSVNDWTNCMLDPNLVYKWVKKTIEKEYFRKNSGIKFR